MDAQQNLALPYIDTRHARHAPALFTGLSSLCLQATTPTLGTHLTGPRTHTPFRSPRLLRNPCSSNPPCQGPTTYNIPFPRTTRCSSLLDPLPAAWSWLTSHVARGRRQEPYGLRLAAHALLLLLLLLNWSMHPPNLLTVVTAAAIHTPFLSPPTPPLATRLVLRSYTLPHHRVMDVSTAARPLSDGAELTTSYALYITVHVPGSLL
ncbi:hypothetical protein XA68_10132 [Ophiocordyceps unilateralis]|uniref:Uncharacterized protein n=1 Tax=Ophiocordyceps unilateralis TaxID=268505 RepID=A0A2A9P1B5_OPHUN|nr:hypothetical protein XA68_10132 [Ophiocordyceps unilateralis]